MVNILGSDQKQNNSDYYFKKEFKSLTDTTEGLNLNYKPRKKLENFSTLQFETTETI